MIIRVLRVRSVTALVGLVEENEQTIKGYVYIFIYTYIFIHPRKRR